MVEKKTIFEQQLEKNPDEVNGDLQKLNFSYMARVQSLVAKTCEGKEGQEFKKCFKQNAQIAGEIYKPTDFYSDNFNASRNNDTSLEKSIKILKKIFNPPK